MTNERPIAQINGDIAQARRQSEKIERAIAEFSKSPEEYSHELAKAARDRDTINKRISELERELEGRA